MQRSSRNLSVVNRCEFMSIIFELRASIHSHRKTINLTPNKKTNKQKSNYLKMSISSENEYLTDSMRKAFSSIMLRNSTTNGIVNIKCRLAIAFSKYISKLSGINFYNNQEIFFSICLSC